MSSGEGVIVETSNPAGLGRGGAIVSSGKVVSEAETPRMLRDESIPRLISVAEAADLLGVSRQYVSQLINEGKLPAAWAGRYQVLREEIVHRFKAGERFEHPALLLVQRYEEEEESWVGVFRKRVPRDFDVEGVLPADVREVLGGGDSYRLELLDGQGRTIQVRRVSAPAVDVTEE